jgi:hypothetical protein
VDLSIPSDDDISDVQEMFQARVAQMIESTGDREIRPPSSLAYVRALMRERERDRKTHTHTHTHRERHTHTHTHMHFRKAPWYLLCVTLVPLRRFPWNMAFTKKAPTTKRMIVCFVFYCSIHTPFLIYISSIQSKSCVFSGKYGIDKVFFNNYVRARTHTHTKYTHTNTQHTPMSHTHRRVRAIPSP